MLKRINNKTVEGTEGFIVRVPNIHEIEYKADDLHAVIEIEGGRSESGGVDWVVYSSTLKVISQHDAAKVQDIEKQVVFERVAKSLELLDMPNSIR